MKIKRISVDQLKPALYNPRKDLKPGDPEYEKLKKSIIAIQVKEKVGMMILIVILKCL